MNLEQIRADTPACERIVHLNNAGAALMPAPVVRTIHEHIELESRIGGYEAVETRAEAIAEAYRSVADLLGAQSANVAFCENSTAAYMQALSAIPFERGDTILTTHNDYASNQIQYLSLQKRLGVRIVRAPDEPRGGVDAQAVRELVRRERPKLVCVTHVPTNSGLVQDVCAVGSVCREEDLLYMVDACQSVGQTPIDVDDIGCDFLSASARKWLRGPRGAGFLYVSDRVLERGLEPLFIDMRGADWTAPDAYRPAPDARRFENFEFAWALVLATGEAARYASAIGLEPIRDRVRALAARLRERLAASGRARILDHGPELCGIVSAWPEGRDPRQLAAALREHGINANAQPRTSAVLDFDAKGVPASLRLSPHYYNTEEEIDRAVEAIVELTTH